MDFLSQLTVTDITEAFTVTAPRAKHTKIKKRKAYGLSFCTSGKITYTKDGKKTVLEPGYAVINPMGATYELYNNLGGEFPLINFTASEKFTEDFILIPIQSFKNYQMDFEKIKTLLLCPNERLKIISTFYEILDKLSKESDKTNDNLSSVLEYINLNFQDTAINNTVLAKKANISEVYLRRIFKQKYGISPKQYILEMRIKLAKQLLLETPLSVSTISSKCGFSNIYHFCKLFKEKTDTTPTDYRKYKII